MKYVFFVLMVFVGACVGSEVAIEGATYETWLIKCNKDSATLCQSIACENDWRALKGRIARSIPAHCKTVKVDGTQTIVKDAGSE